MLRDHLLAPQVSDLSALMTCDNNTHFQTYGTGGYRFEPCGVYFFLAEMLSA